MNYEYIVAHISDYIQNENFFDTFNKEDIKQIMKYSTLTANQYVTLLKQSSTTIKAKELYVCTRNANVTIQNMEEVVSTLKSVKKYMKFNIFDGIIDILDQKEQEIPLSTEGIQNPRQNAAKETNVNQTNGNINDSREIFTKIAELKKSSDFERVYNFFKELSAQGNQEMIQKACEEGLLEKKIMCGNNVLHIACERGNLRLVKSLIECKCDKEVKNDDGCTPLICASLHGCIEVVQYLISVGANKEARDNNGGWTPLISASANGQLEVVQYLISVGANKEAKDNGGCTPLIWSSANDQLETVHYLISVGADKEAKDNDGKTPLIWASYFGYLEIVQYLISIGANKEAKSNDGYTPLIWASQRGYLEVVQYLISVGANKEVKSNNGCTPLIYASANGFLEVVQYLISVGANKEVKIKE